MKTLYFVTSNKGKLVEAEKKLSEINIKIIQKNLGYPEIQAETLKDVILFGSKYIQKKLDQPFIIEDAGLFINKLNGFPGVYSSYVFHTLGCNGILKLMKDFLKEERKACFKSVIGYCEPDKKPKILIGKCNGIISDKQHGDHGFGYDPIFIPYCKKTTFAEMDVYEKNKYSHRGESFKKLLEILKR